MLGVRSHCRRVRSFPSLSLLFEDVQCQNPQPKANFLSPRAACTAATNAETQMQPTSLPPPSTTPSTSASSQTQSRLSYRQSPDVVIHALRKHQKYLHRRRPYSLRLRPLTIPTANTPPTSVHTITITSITATTSLRHLRKPRRTNAITNCTIERMVAS